METDLSKNIKIGGYDTTLTNEAIPFGRVIDGLLIIQRIAQMLV